MIYLAWFCYLFTGSMGTLILYANFDYWRFERKLKGAKMVSKDFIDAIHCRGEPLTEPWRSEFCTVSENGLRVMYVSPVGANGSRAAVFLDDRGRYNSFDHANRYLVPLKKERVAVERWAVVNEKGEPSGHFESESMAHGVASMLKEQTWVVKLTGEYER